MKEKYIQIAYEEAKKAYDIGEVPVGCIIVYENKIIAKAHNLKEKKRDSTAHAEILAIKKASRYLKSWRLNGCVMYTTVFPCPMCMGAIRESRIGNVVYLIDSSVEKKYYNDLIVEKSDYLSDDSLMLLKKFFYEKR